MTISRISSASAASDSVTLGTHAAGDMIFIWSWNDGSATIPSLPAGWLSIHTATAATGSYRLGYNLAASGSETSGTWTNADGLIAVVYRSDVGIVVPAFFATNTATNTTVAYSAIVAAANRENVDQWFFGAAVQRNETNALETAPSGMTNVTSQVGTGFKMAWHDTNADANSFTAANVSVTTSALWRTVVVQVFEQAYPTSSGGGAMFLPRGFDGGYFG